VIVLSSFADPARLIAVFGVGLIGAATARTIQSMAPFDVSEVPCSWTDRRSQAEQLVRIRELLVSRIERGPSCSWATPIAGRLTVLWSAGQAGFSATEREADDELSSFRNVLRTIQQIAAATRDTVVSFVLISSAGGLFEGQQLIGKHSVPAPRRPYGWLKLAQEEALLATGDSLIKRIYRPTSVYGFVRRGERRGLIPTLVANGLGYRVTTIVGRPSTLRDFVWVEDVASFLAKELLDLGHSNPVDMGILASGKPTSIIEVRQIVECAINRKLYVTYSPEVCNGADTTFSSDALPARWRFSPLSWTARRICADAVCGGVASRPQGGTRRSARAPLASECEAYS
jgi:UDP-glucose 4-epimerase